MKDENYRDNRGNVVLLTVIAIVTMVIVLVGATFAYLASNIEGSKSANINATTNAGSDLFLITPGEDLSITANEVNFAYGLGDLSADSTAAVTFQTTSTADEGVTKEYEVKLEILSNNFEYTSGKCYKTPTGANATDDGVTSAANCTGNNVWATNGSGYACYIGTDAPNHGLTRVLGNTYSNQLSCLSINTNMWAPEEIAELVVDLYRDDATYTDETSCKAAGVCVNNKRVIESSYTSKNDCEGVTGNTWLPNIWEEKCYHLTAAKDITTARADTDVQLIDSVSINAKAGTTTHHYKPMVTFINFGHNQIVNGQKNFSARLTFALINV